MSIYKIISYLTYPALWATVGVAILNPVPDSLVSVLTASFILHSLVPLIFVIYLLKTGQTKSIDLPELSSRIKTVIVAGVCALIFQFFIISDQQLRFWNQLVFVSLITQFIFNNLNFKISIHVMAITAFFAYFTFDEKLFLNASGVVITLATTALVAFSRFKVKAHSPIELITGFTMGIVIVFINQWAYNLWR